MDGHRAGSPIRTRTHESLYHNEQPGHGSLTTFLSLFSPAPTAAYEKIATDQALNDIRPDFGRPSRNHTVAGRGDTTPVVDAKQPFPGCHRIQPVGGATMPFALSQGGSREFFNSQFRPADLRGTTATRSTVMLRPQHRAIVANRSSRRNSCRRTQRYGGCPEKYI